MSFSKRLSQLVRERQPALGMWINLGDPAVAQIAALAGYDWVMIDTEHNPFTDSQVLGLLHALGGTEVTPIVRVRANREEHVKWVLDAGAGGIIIPSIRDADDARHAVSIAKYHPLGARGYGPNRATGFWTDTAQYNANANLDVLLICQVELASAIADIEQICQIPGIDGIFIGPGDLAQSLGQLGNPAHPTVVAAIDTIIQTANRHGKPWGIPVSIEDYPSRLKQGGQIFALGSDTRFLKSAATTLVAAARQHRNEKP